MIFTVVALTTCLGLHPEAFPCDCMQGQYAFAIYDGHRKQVFAARDPSGSEPLYMHVDDDDGVRCAGYKCLHL